jgi:hypothetical protein
MKKNWKIIIALLLAAWLINSSCYTNKKATKQVSKAIENKPLIAAKLLRDAFPCITVKTDTTVLYKDSVIVVDCPTPSTDYFTITDTLNHIDTIYKTVITKVPITVQVPSKVVTKYIEDSAKVKLITGENQFLHDNIVLLNDKITTYQKHEGSLWWTIKNFLSFRWVWLLIALTALYLFRKPLLLIVRKLINPLA